MRGLLKWLLIYGLVAMWIEFPRGGHAKDGIYSITTPIIHFSWSGYAYNLLDLWHRVLHGSPGDVAGGGQTIVTAIAHGTGTSLELLAFGLLFVLIFGISKGIYDGLKVSNPSAFGVLSSGMQWLMESIPDFFLIIILEVLSFFLLRQGIKFYVIGSQQFTTGVLLPAAIIAVLPTAYLARMVSLAVAEQFGQQYMVTAMAKGLTKSKLMIRHLLPNLYPSIANTLIPVFAMLFGNLVMVEYLMYKQGIVSTLFYAMGQKGYAPVFTPHGDPAAAFTYYPFDPQLTLSVLITCILIFLLAFALLRSLLWMLGYKGQVNPYTAQPLESNRKYTLPWQLGVGGAWLAGIFLLGLLAKHLPMPGPNVQDPLQYQGNSMSMPPFPPSFHHLLGTDASGRDLLSRVIFGTLPTFEHVLIPVFITVLMAAMLAVLTSLVGIPGLRFAISIWDTVFTFVPGIIAALLILQIPDVYWFGAKFLEGHIVWGVSHEILYLGVLVMIVGGRVTAYLVHVLDLAAKKEYMHAAKISGNSRWTNLLLHYWPALRDGILEQAVIQFSAILMLMGTLGFFLNPLGEQYLVVNGLSPAMAVWKFLPVSLDWPSVIAENVRDFFGNPWVVLAPVLFISMTVIAMNLILTGIRIWTRSKPVRNTPRLYRWQWGIIVLMSGHKKRRSYNGHKSSTVLTK